jgi:hypothetical protein
MIEPTYVDGNALGGLLGEVFAADLTTATTTCAGCGARAALANLRVYLDAPGAVGRCAGCGIPQIRIARSDQHHRIDLSGMRLLEIPRSALS